MRSDEEHAKLALWFPRRVSRFGDSAQTQVEKVQSPLPTGQAGEAENSAKNKTLVEK
jgi:hypothetical protein